MDYHIDNLWIALNLHLRRISKIRDLLTVDVTNKLAVALILSRLELNNSLLTGLTDRKLAHWQEIQNDVTWLVLRHHRRSCHFSPSIHALSIRKCLHWIQGYMPIFFKALQLDSSTKCTSELHRQNTPIRTLRSLDVSLLSCPKYSLIVLPKDISLLMLPSSGTLCHLSYAFRTGYYLSKQHLKLFFLTNLKGMFLFFIAR